jgi:multidrug efflux pump subunit AcrB
VFLRFDGAYNSEQAIADTPIVAGGRTLKLSDLADIRRGYEDPATYIIRHNGEPVVMLGVVMQQGWNGLELGKSLEERSAAIAQTLPLGMTLKKSAIRPSTLMRPLASLCSNSPWLLASFCS